jgi:hypothetical protein
MTRRNVLHAVYIVVGLSSHTAPCDGLRNGGAAMSPWREAALPGTATLPYTQLFSFDVAVKCSSGDIESFANLRNRVVFVSI